MSDLRLVVNGRKYGGWKAVRVTRSIESLAGSFDLEVSDRWGGQDEPWPVVEEDECRVEIDGIPVVDGFVDKRSLSISGNSRRLSFTGRDRAAALVENSVLLPKWTFRNATVLDIAEKIAEPFGIEVTLQDGVQIRPLPKLVVNPGDSAFEAIQRAADMSGVLPISDGEGGVLLARSGSVRVETSLVEGVNILAAGVDYDATNRYARYVIATQAAGTDNASGGATRIRAEATDPAVRRQDRVLVIRPDAGITTEFARQRADWEARIRAAQAETVTVTVQGWKQRGKLWPLNAIVHVRSPSIGVDGDLLIAAADHELGDGGELTEIRLVRPDAFLPEPQKAKVGKGGGAWKEIN